MVIFKKFRILIDGDFFLVKQEVRPSIWVNIYLQGFSSHDLPHKEYYF